MEIERIVVAFQGEPGSYSEKATRDYFGSSVATMPCRSFSDIFAAIHEERATFGMLPVENSLAGTVVPAYDLLIDHDLRVPCFQKDRIHLMRLGGGILFGHLYRQG